MPKKSSLSTKLLDKGLIKARNAQRLMAMQSQAVDVLQLVINDAIQTATKGQLEYNPRTKRMHLVKRPPNALAVQASQAILDRTGLSPEVVTRETLGPQEEVKRFIVEFVDAPERAPLPVPQRAKPHLFERKELPIIDVRLDE